MLLFSRHQDITSAFAKPCEERSMNFSVCLCMSLILFSSNLISFMSSSHCKCRELMPFSSSTTRSGPIRHDNLYCNTPISLSQTFSIFNKLCISLSKLISVISAAPARMLLLLTFLKRCILESIFMLSSLSCSIKFAFSSFKLFIVKLHEVFHFYETYFLCLIFESRSRIHNSIEVSSSLTFITLLLLFSSKLRL